MVDLTAHPNVEAIREVYNFSNILQEMMEESKDRKLLRQLAHDIELCYYELQRLSNIKETSKTFKFWNLPKCSCPTMDNNDAYPSGYYTVNSDCVLHG